MVIPLPMFTAPSYGDRTLNEVQRCVNLYPEKTPQGWKLVGTPGLILYATVGNDQPCRGAYLTSTGRIFSVHDDDIYEIGGLAATDRGNLLTTTGSVRYCDNGTYMLVVDGIYGYVYNFGTNAFTQISDLNFPSNPSGCCFLDGYFIVIDAATDTFYLSQLNDPADWTPVTSAVAESSGDNLVACISTGSEVKLIGRRTIEPWYNTGNADFPLERISGGTIKLGTNSPDTIAVSGQDIYMVAYGEGMAPGVWVVGGSGPRKISPPYVDTAVFSGTTYGMIYQDDLGHRCYQLNVSSTSFVYDIDQGTWFEKDSNVSSSYTKNRITHAVQDANGIPTLFDGVNGKLYQLVSSTNTEDGTAIRRLRAFGPIEAGARRMFHHKIIFVLEIDHDSSASYTLSASLDWTDDGGLTWSTARTLSKTITSGTTGQRVQLEANRLGSSRQRYYRITFTGPAARIVLQSAELEADVGSN